MSEFGTRDPDTVKRWSSEVFREAIAETKLRALTAPRSWRARLFSWPWRPWRSHDSPIVVMGRSDA